MDDQIWRLLSELRMRGFKENLLVVITSDHGEAFGEHGTFLHGHSLYQEEIHVPLIFWRPGQVPSGVQVAQPVSIVSLAATLMDLIGMNRLESVPRPITRRILECTPAAGSLATSVGGNKSAFLGSQKIPCVPW